MKIEILFPEFCNLYGDLANMATCAAAAPGGVCGDVPPRGAPAGPGKGGHGLPGPMTERLQEAVLEKLRPLRARIWELIDQDTLFLCTGNALELFGQYIVKEDGSRLECLSLFPLYAQRDMMHRHNSVFLGSFEGKA